MTFVAVLVIFTFVIGFHALFIDFSDSDAAGGTKIGTLRDEPLTDRQFEQAKRMARIHLLLVVGITDDAPDFVRYVHKTAWRMLASIRYAAKLGITVSPEEARKSELAQFTKDGVFNAEAYDDFMTRRLRQMGISPKEFHDFMHSSLVLSKVENAVSAAAWLPPYDMSREMSRLTDSFLIDLVDIPTTSLDEPVKVTEDEARAYFESHSRAFLQPDRMRVKYVVFPVSNFTALAAALPESRAREYYEINASEFQQTSNEIAVVRSFDDVKESIISNLVLEATTNYYDKNFDSYVVTGTNDMEVARPFAEVKDEIVRVLATRDAQMIAEEKASEFVDTMNPGPNGIMMPLERAAAATNLTVYTSPYFGRHERIEGLDVSFEFNRQAFDGLQAGDPYDHFSAPIVETDSVYVISYDDKIERHLPDFNTVSNMAFELARKEKMSTVVAAKAEAIQKALQAGLKAGKSFREAADSQKLSTIAAGPFTWFTQPTNIAVSASLLKSLTLCKEGELTKPLATTNGMAIAYVVSRVQGMSSADLSIVQFLAETMREEKAKRMFIDWQQRLLEHEKVVEQDKELAEAAGTTNEPEGVLPPAEDDAAQPENGF